MFYIFLIVGISAVAIILGLVYSRRTRRLSIVAIVAFAVIVAIAVLFDYIGRTYFLGFHYLR